MADEKTPPPNPFAPVLAQITSYFNRRGKLPKAATDDDKCSQFAICDNNLADILSNVGNQMNNGKLPKICTISFNGGADSRLRKRCCDCPNDGIKWYDKNELRTKAEAELSAFMRLAAKWTGVFTPSKAQPYTPPTTELDEESRNVTESDFTRLKKHKETRPNVGIKYLGG